MSTGAEHYRRAEGLIANAWARVGRDGVDYLHLPEVRDRLIANAQVHATLALAAATVEASAESVGGGIFVGRPSKAEPEVGEPAFRGSPWGRAFYGDLKDGDLKDGGQ